MVQLSEMWYWLLLAFVISYAIGNINFAVIISNIKNRDIRQVGSGNPGTMNMSRNFGLKIGALTMFLDMFKGGIPTVVGYFVFRGLTFEGGVSVSDLARYLCAIGAIMGHVYPVAMKFHGGKGIASTMGAFWFGLACENGWFFLIAFLLLVITLLYIAFTEWGSMGSLFGVSLLAGFQCLLFFQRYNANGVINGFVVFAYMLVLAICFITWFAHRKNIVRLLSGEEHHTGVKSKKKKAA